MFSWIFFLCWAKHLRNEPKYYNLGDFSGGVRGVVAPPPPHPPPPLGSPDWYYSVPAKTTEIFRTDMQTGTRILEFFVPICKLVLEYPTFHLRSDFRLFRAILVIPDNFSRDVNSGQYRIWPIIKKKKKKVKVQTTQARRLPEWTQRPSPLLLLLYLLLLSFVSTG